MEVPVASSYGHIQQPHLSSRLLLKVPWLQTYTSKKMQFYKKWYADDICSDVHHFDRPQDSGYPTGRKERMRCWGEQQVLDTDQTGTRVRLHNSWVDSYGLSTYDWVVFIITAKKKANIWAGRERDKQGTKEKNFEIKEIPILAFI